MEFYCVNMITCALTRLESKNIKSTLNGLVHLLQHFVKPDEVVFLSDCILQSEESLCMLCVLQRELYLEIVLPE